MCGAKAESFTGNGNEWKYFEWDSKQYTFNQSITPATPGGNKTPRLHLDKTLRRQRVLSPDA